MILHQTDAVTSFRMRKLSFILISTFMVLMLVAACSSPGPRRGGGEDLDRWGITDSADLATGLWHGRADCRFGPLSNDEVLVGLRSSKNRYDAYIARITTSTRPAIVSWRATGQVDSAGDLVLLPDLSKKQLLSYAQPVTVLINDSRDDKLHMKAGDITQRGNPASRCQPIALRRVFDGKASDFLVDGRLSNVDALTATRSLTGMRNDLGGLWEGSMVCRDRIEPVRIRINQADNGGWTSTFRFGTRPAIDYGLEPVPTVLAWPIALLLTINTSFAATVRWDNSAAMT